MNLTEHDWMRIAEQMLEIERTMRPLHHPPSTPVIVRWRNEQRIGMVQSPVSHEFPAIVFLSITSRHRQLGYVDAVRKLDPGRLELRADDRLDLDGNFHVLRRADDFLTFMTDEETAHMESGGPAVVMQIQPSQGGFTVAPVTESKFQQEPKPPSEKVQ